MGKVLDPVPDTCKYSMSRVFKREHKKDQRLGFVQNKQALDTCKLMGAIRQPSAPNHDTV